MTHISVLLKESIDGLALVSGDVFVDCTLGNGGHSLEVFRRFGTQVKIVGLDIDSAAIARATSRLASEGGSIAAVTTSFRNIDQALDGLGIPAADKILMDLGLSSNQLEESGRGFSFQKDEPLLMTFSENAKSGLTAEMIVNDWDAENIATVLQSYGDERHGWRIAQAIVEARSEKRIGTTAELVEIIKAAVPASYRHGKIHPATRTFQALRMTVNDELQALIEALPKAFERLNPSGRIAVISFHSGEDRIVKNFFRDSAKRGTGELVTKKPVIPTDGEIGENPRARSAKLRILKKL